MNKQKLVYIASPVRAVVERFSVDICEGFKEAKRMATFAAIRVKKAGHVPISPVLMFDGVYEEYFDRAQIMEACAALVAICDEIYVVDNKYTKYSDGIKKELEIAKQCGLTQVDYFGAGI
ncbi:MAG: DUF4406 domain-containing protein [Campylobacteraceae bacterium]|jgi:hypothetical protein|nr:DUF4406 domain-containing protein [Campylobacteraceae bacterium]